MAKLPSASAVCVSAFLLVVGTFQIISMFEKQHHSGLGTALVAGAQHDVLSARLCLGAALCRECLVVDKINNVLKLRFQLLVNWQSYFPAVGNSSKVGKAKLYV